VVDRERTIAHSYFALDFERIHDAVAARDELRNFIETVATRIASM
jgi:hypothetical protein